MEERKARFHNGCREGHTEVSFTGTGINLQLMFNANLGLYHNISHHHSHHFERELDFDKEHGKVSSFCLVLSLLLISINNCMSTMIDTFN